MAYLLAFTTKAHQIETKAAYTLVDFHTKILITLDCLTNVIQN